MAGFTILASIIAFYASARSLQDGEAVPVIAATSTAANVSCILGGILVFGDPMPGDALGIVIQAVAFTLVSSPRWSRRRRCAPPRRTPSLPRLRRGSLQQHARDLIGVVPHRHVPAAAQHDVARVGQPPSRPRRLAGGDQQPVALAPGDRRGQAGPAAPAVERRSSVRNAGAGASSRSQCAASSGGIRHGRATAWPRAACGARALRAASRDRREARPPRRVSERRAPVAASRPATNPAGDSAQAPAPRPRAPSPARRAPERVARDVRPLEARARPRASSTAVGEPLHVSGARRRGAEARQVDRDHLALAREQRQHRTPHSLLEPDPVHEHQRRTGPGAAMGEHHAARR